MYCIVQLYLVVKRLLKTIFKNYSDTPFHGMTCVVDETEELNENERI